jgi:hypothetical protein
VVRNFVTIIASRRPRVGKTLVARLLTDFHLYEGRSVAAFDLNFGNGTLAQFLPEHATSSEIGDVKGQMALFDRLIADDGINKVVDVGCASFETFVALASQLDLAKEAQSYGVAMVVLYLMTPDSTSIETYRSLRNRLPQAVLTPVHNEIFGAAHYLNKYAPIGSGTVVMRLPSLASKARKVIERPPFSFADSACVASLEAETNAELQHFLQRMHREFRELCLRSMLIDLKSSIQL